MKHKKKKMMKEQNEGEKQGEEELKKEVRTAKDKGKREVFQSGLLSLLACGPACHI